MRTRTKTYWVKSHVRFWRRLRGMTQQDLSDDTGIPRSTIGAIETGRNIPNVEYALLLAQALRRHVEDIFQIVYDD